MEKIVKNLKNLNTYRYIVSVIFILEAIYRTIIFTNAGSNVEQAQCFRPLCIGLAIVVLINMDIKMWFNLWTLIFSPICFFFVKIAYEKQWIYDVNNYAFPGLIRLGKIIILLWGIVLISIIRHIIKNKSWRNLGKVRKSVWGLFVLYFICVLLFMRHYTEILFFMVAVVGVAFVMSIDGRRHIIIKAVTDAIILSFIYSMYMSLRHRPYDCERYDLIFSNSNHAGAYLACTVIALFTKIDLWWKDTEHKKAVKVIALILYFILLGIDLSVTMFNYTRTTIAGLGFAFIVAFIVSLTKAKKKKKRGILARYGLVIVSLILTFNITFLALRYIPAYYAAYVDSPVFYVGEAENDVKIHFGESMDSPKYTTMGSYLRTVFGKWGILIKFDDDKESANQEESVEFDGRDVTGGRMEIWSLFISNFNMTGHELFYLYDENDELIPHSHNSYIMVTHMLGLIAGAIYALFNLVAFLVSIVAYKREEDKDSSYLFMLLLISTVMISQMAEWISRPQYSLYMIFIFGVGMLLNCKKNKPGMPEIIVDADSFEKVEGVQDL